MASKGIIILLQSTKRASFCRMRFRFLRDTNNVNSLLSRYDLTCKRTCNKIQSIMFLMIDGIFKKEHKENCTHLREKSSSARSFSWVHFFHKTVGKPSLNRAKTVGKSCLFSDPFVKKCQRNSFFLFNKFRKWLANCNACNKPAP